MGVGESGVVRIDEPVDLLVERYVGRHHLQDAGNEGRGDAKPDRPSEVRLRSEVVMQEGLVHACLIGDLLHARAVDAAPDEDLVGGVEDAGLGVGGGLSRRFNHLVSKAMAVPAFKSSIFPCVFLRFRRRTAPAAATVSGQDPRHFGGRETTTPDGRPREIEGRSALVWLQRDVVLKNRRLLEMAEWSMAHAWKAISATLTKQHRRTSTRNRINGLPLSDAPRSDAVFVSVRRDSRARLTQSLHNSRVHLRSLIAGDVETLCRSLNHSISSGQPCSSMARARPTLRAAPALWRQQAFPWLGARADTVRAACRTGA